MPTCHAIQGLHRDAIACNAIPHIVIVSFFVVFQLQCVPIPNAVRSWMLPIGVKWRQCVSVLLWVVVFLCVFVCLVCGWMGTVCGAVCLAVCCFLGQ